MALNPFESKIQDMVYHVDAGVGLRLIKMALYILFLLVIMVVYTATQFRGLKDAEAMDYAQLGRNMMMQGKMVTQCIRPASIWYLTERIDRKDAQIRQHPDILHPPLYPYLLSIGFRVFQSSFTAERAPQTFPPEQWVVVPFGLLCSMLTGLVLYLMARRLFDERVALMGVTIYFLSDAVWGMSISGLGISLATLMTSLAFYTAIIAAANRRDETASYRWFIPLLGSVIFCILAFLTRYATAVLVPALAVYVGLSFKTNRWKWIAAFIVIFLIGISPWLIRNLMVSHGLLGLAPYTALNGADPVIDNVFERSLHPKLDGVAAGLGLKWLTNMAMIYSQQLRTVGDGFLICFFLTTFFYAFARDSVRLFRWCVALAMCLLMSVAALFGEPTIRLLFIFWPVIIIYSLAFFLVLLERLQLRIPLLRISVTGLLILLSATPLIFRLLPPRATVPYPPYYPPYISHVCRMLTPDELLCTDMPWATAWYGSRNSLLLPQTVDDFYEIHDYNPKRTSGIYFTTITRDQPYVHSLINGINRTWFPILEGRIPSDFPFTQGFPLNGLDQLFLTDDRARLAK